jgi:hypothetical protein
MIELTFSNLLFASASITAICGNRIYPVRLATDATMPAIHYMFVAGTSKPTFDGRGSQKYRVEVSCWGDSYNDAVTLRAAVVSALDQYVAPNLYIQFLMNTDLDDHQTLQSRCLCEFYLFADFTS